MTYIVNNKYKKKHHIYMAEGRKRGVAEGWAGFHSGLIFQSIPIIV
jgi:hypothetical protein